MRGIGQRRRVLAIVACIAWLLGVEALPAVHLAHHEADHTHDASGTIVHHGDHDHVAPITPRDHHQDLAQLAIDHPVDSGHQAGGVAHHALALHQPVPPQLPPIAFAISRDERAIQVSSTGTRAVATHARGPPRSTTT